MFAGDRKPSSAHRHRISLPSAATDSNLSPVTTLRCTHRPPSGPRSATGDVRARVLQSNSASARAGPPARRPGKELPGEEASNEDQIMGKRIEGNREEGRGIGREGREGREGKERAKLESKSPI